MTVRVFERLERIKHHRVEYRPAGDTVAEMAATVEWVRAKGHQAASLELDGFRYRSAYPDGSTGPWYWIEPGQWLCLMEGEAQDSEFDAPHDEGPDDHLIYPSDEWHEITEAAR
ncbi:MAG TPA: hypothetical protein VGE38_04890 [Nocardioides sp.]|uniref:hypothetical protein n=1 Tax=Nocardioides sp. TaxID=35761 RepID=UPI002EDA3C07